MKKLNKLFLFIFSFIGFFNILQSEDQKFSLMEQLDYEENKRDYEYYQQQVRYHQEKIDSYEDDVERYQRYNNSIYDYSLEIAQINIKEALKNIKYHRKEKKNYEKEVVECFAKIRKYENNYTKNLEDRVRLLEDLNK